LTFSFSAISILGKSFWLQIKKPKYYFLDGKVALWSQRFGSTLQDNGFIHAQVRAQQMIFIAIKKRFKFWFESAIAYRFILAFASLSVCIIWKSLRTPQKI
jgi:hypothetical protein